MPFVKKEILDRLLKDEQDWRELLEQQTRQARKIGYETAQAATSAQVSSANQLTADANVRIEELTIDRDTIERLLDIEKGAVRAISSQIRQTALDLAGRYEDGDIVAKAKEFEAYLRGESATTTEYETNLINSGWNSALEYLRAELGDPESTICMQVQQGLDISLASTLSQMQREV